MPVLIIPIAMTHSGHMTIPFGKPHTNTPSPSYKSFHSKCCIQAESLLDTEPPSHMLDRVVMSQDTPKPHPSSQSPSLHTEEHYMDRQARPHPPHTHKADTAERGTLAEQEGAQFHALIQQIQKDHEIVASICGVSTINVEEMCGCCE